MLSKKKLVAHTRKENWLKIHLKSSKSMRKTLCFLMITTKSVALSEQQFDAGMRKALDHF